MNEPLGSDIAVVVLAAGDGKRLRSSRPKVIHEAAGRPLLGYVLDACVELDPVSVTVVVSPKVDRIRAALGGSAAVERAGFVVQDPPRGTADAVKVALREIPGDAAVLVLPGDVPLIDPSQLRELAAWFFGSDAAAALLTSDADEPAGYGRILRTPEGAVLGIVEHRDATEEQRAIREVNSGIAIFQRGPLEKLLEKVDDRNAQGELYLTDVVGLMASEGLKVAAHKGPADVLRGVNSRVQLAEVEAIMRERTCRRWMEEGVTIVDPSSTFIDATVRIEPDVTLLPFTFLHGETVVREGAEVGPQCRIIDSDIGTDAQVSFSVLRGAQVGEGATVGPFASLRPGTVLGPHSRAGTFVETKNTILGEHSKVPHLSYMGDADIGDRVNVGAGSITCNWDGREKHGTQIDDDAYVGSDTMLVAPVHLKARSATGAGSVVRGEVPEDALAVGVPARVIEGKGDRMGARSAAADKLPEREPVQRDRDEEGD